MSAISIATTPPITILGERFQRKHLLAFVANLIGARMSSCRPDSHPSMQRKVIGRVLANHQRAILIPRSIGMMNNRTFRKRFTQSAFSPKPMD
jgi:hypothetical protein